MIKYTSQYQSRFEQYGNLYQLKLNPDNRWIRLGFHLPWDKLVKIYAQRFSSRGTVAINPRIIIGSLIIKHKLNLSDEETIQSIEENPYMQFFLGLDSFYPEPLFSPSLFVDLRKKLGRSTFDEFTDVLIQVCFADKIKTRDTTDQQALANKGKLKLDATVADQYIRYPNDLGLLNEAREKTEALIDELFVYLKDTLKIKPRTYRRVAHQKYMSEAKKRQKNIKTLRSAIRYMLNCLDRNIRSVNMMLDMVGANPLKFKQMQEFWIIQTLKDQQRMMYSEKINRCEDRIVSISQPHVRPIVRGKQGKKVEFGSKLGLALMDGFVKAGTLNWDAYRESRDLIPHVEAYKVLYGYYPELVQVDKIYGTNQNRTWCKERNIRITVTPKGKTKELSPYQKKKLKKEYAERNQIEGKIGQAKQGYRLNQIKAKLKNTSECWIGVTLFITNLVRFAEIHDFHF